jgi:hypothetical protein
MGGEYFDNFRTSDDCNGDLEATFGELRSQALYEHGHGGYSGTIAEKPGVELRSSKTFTYDEAEDFANRDMDDNDHDKWGPAWAVRVDDPKRGKGFYFYGIASS